MTRGRQIRAEAARLRWATVAGLRSWARGSLAEEAAVELLVSYSGGRFAQPGCAWVRPCVRPGWYWLDCEALAAYAERSVLPERRRVLQLAAALASGDRVSRRRATSGRAAA